MALERSVISIAYADGRVVRYPVLPRTEMLFERLYKVGLNRIGDGNEGTNNVYKLAYEVQKVNLADYPTGIIPAFEEWADGVLALDMEREPIVPFAGARSANGSSTSPLPAGSPSGSS